MTANPLDQVIAEMRDTVESGEPMKFRYIGRWIDMLESMRPAAGGEADGNDSELQAYREMHFRLDTMLGERLKIALEGGYAAAIANTLASVERLTHPAPAAREVPDCVVELLNHIEDVLPDDAFNLISHEKWNAVTGAVFIQRTTTREAVPGGMVLVPREATHEMMVAYWQSGSDEPIDTSLLTDGDLAVFREDWRDMLAAASPPQATDEQGRPMTYWGGRVPEVKPQEGEEVPCNPDPRAPHGFDRNGSHNAGRYVCDCEGWEPPAAPPHSSTTRKEK